MEKNIQLYKGDCLEVMKQIPDKSVDVILTDPPYKYLKNQKLERDFDETAFFEQVKRILKKDGFIVMFGRGTSFYRWNTILDELGFTFKEEIVWDKGHCTSPLMNLSRIHETISISTKGHGTLRKVKVPYLEMKHSDIEGIITDIKRLRVVLGNPKSLKAVSDFLVNNHRDVSDEWKANNLSISSHITKEDRCVSVMRSIRNGMNEKTIIRTDRYPSDTFTKYGVNCDKRLKGDRCADVMQSMEYGLTEKSIIKQTREHYTAIHPTQKPVRLLERLLNLVCDEGATVLDPFMGSGSTGMACINTNRKFIGIEIDDEYYEGAEIRIENAVQAKEQTLFTENAEE